MNESMTQPSISEQPDSMKWFAWTAIVSSFFWQSLKMMSNQIIQLKSNPVHPSPFSVVGNGFPPRAVFKGVGGKILQVIYKTVLHTWTLFDFFSRKLEQKLNKKCEGENVSVWQQLMGHANGA